MAPVGEWKTSLQTALPKWCAESPITSVLRTVRIR